MTEEDLFQRFREDLAPIYGDGELRSMCRIVFEDVVRKADFVSTKIDEIHSRLKAQEPLQYILGEADFYSLKFKVSPAVLIPRQETEELVALFRQKEKKGAALKVLEVGTGSGCIPITIKYSHPRVNFTALEYSADALLIAQANARRHQQKIDFVQMDFCNQNRWSSLDKYDAIISNPPYIGIAEAENLEQNVLRYEPHLALFSPRKDANYFYQLIHKFSKTNLRQGGRIYLELNEYNAQAVKAIFDTEDFAEVTIVQDIHQKDRMLYAIKRIM